MVNKPGGRNSNNSNNSSYVDYTEFDEALIEFFKLFKNDPYANSNFNLFQLRENNAEKVKELYRKLKEITSDYNKYKNRR